MTLAPKHCTITDNVPAYDGDKIHAVFYRDYKGREHVTASKPFLVEGALEPDSNMTHILSRGYTIYAMYSLDDAQLRSLLGTTK